MVRVVLTMSAQDCRESRSRSVVMIYEQSAVMQVSPESIPQCAALGLSETPLLASHFSWLLKNLTCN